MDTMSAGGKASILVALAQNLVTASYTGPIFQLRRSGDDSLGDFYADSFGRLSLGSGGTGTPLLAWLGNATAYVAVWYDQSGNGRHATQTVTSLQPKYSTIYGYVDFKPSAYMLMVASSVPPGNGVYSYVTRVNAINNANGGVFGIGNNAYSQGINLRRDTSRYFESWYNNDFGFGAYAPGNIVSETYDQTNRRGYVNGALQSTQASSNRNGGTSLAYLGKTTADTTLNGELYYLFTSSMVLSDADRSRLETWPSTGII